MRQLLHSTCANGAAVIELVEHIYALTDSDNIVRYVGRTCNPELRHRAHSYGSLYTHPQGDGPVAKWAATVRASGRPVLMHILKKVPANRGRFWEHLFIAMYASPLLLNVKSRSARLLEKHYGPKRKRRKPDAEQQHTALPAHTVTPLRPTAP
jgi:hypothetical protein